MTATAIGYVAGLYAQAERDAERLRHDPVDRAEIRAVNEELDEISAWLPITRPARDDLGTLPTL